MERTQSQDVEKIIKPGKHTHQFFLTGSLLKKKIDPSPPKELKIPI